MKKIKEERKRFLMGELRAYEKATPMTTDEREALHHWVKAGNSVHENQEGAFRENGRPMDFLDIYRQDREIHAVLDSMSYEEGTAYLRREYGINRPERPLSYSGMMKKVDRLYRTCVLCWEVLVANDLRDEAYEYI